MKSILVPTDFSKCAENATQVAHAIALKSDAHIYFLHMFTDYWEPVHVPQSSDHIIARHPKEGIRRARLEKFVERAEAEGIEATSIFVYDHGTEKVSDYLESYDIDLVVMGSHGIGGLKEWVTGSNAKYVARHSTIPVLVIKSIPRKFEVKDILFPSTFTHDISEPMKRIVNLAGIFRANIHLLYVNMSDVTGDSGQQEHLLDYFREQFPKANFYSNVINTNDELWGIGEFIHTYPSDIIAVSRGEHDSSFFSKSIAESLIKREELPVLIV